MKVKEKVVLVGSGGHARVVLDILDEIDRFDLVGITTNDDIDVFSGRPVLGRDDVLPGLLAQGVRYAAVGVGGYRDNVRRARLFRHLKDVGFEIPALVHPSAVVARSAHLEEGCVVFAGVVVGAGAVLGRNVVVATGSTVDHETTIENDVLVSAGVTIGANVRVGRGSLIALGANVISHVDITEECLIGAGAVVVGDCPEPGVYLGIPARLRT